MKKKLTSQSAFFNPRTLFGLAMCLFGFVITLYAAGVLPGAPASKPIVPAGATPGSQHPDVMKMVGPVSQDLDLRLLPYVPPNFEQEVRPLTNHPFPRPALTAAQSAAQMQRLGGASFYKQTMQAMVALTIPSPALSFDTIDSNLSGCGCFPPDTDGDVGPNHYMQSVNSSIPIHDKSGNVLAGPITYNSFFSPLGTSTPCGNNQNDGDGVVFYDHMADRWVVSDFAFRSPGRLLLSMYRRSQDERSSRGRLVSLRRPGGSGESDLSRRLSEIRFVARCLLPDHELISTNRSRPFKACAFTHSIATA